MSPANVATITVRAADVPEVRRLLDALMAEHRALHAYFVDRLFHTQEGGTRYSDLIVAHDDVAELIAERDDTDAR